MCVSRIVLFWGILKQGRQGRIQDFGGDGGPGNC